ncbi:MAG: glycosyltransferase [Steroidobacteraceae bacterium]
MNSAIARRPRILFLIRTLSGAGAELVVESLCRGLDPRRFECSACEISGHGEKARDLRSAAYTVHALNADEQQMTLARILWRLRRVVVANRIDLIHTHSTDALGLAAMCGWTVPHLRHVHTFHFGNYPNHTPTHLRLERLFHRFTDQLVAVGRVQASALSRTYGIAENELQVIWNGVDARPVRIDHERLAPFRKDGRVLIATIGTLIPQKGHRDLIAVAVELKCRGVPARFLIVGGGPLREELEGLVRKAGLQDSVVFLGWIKDSAETILPGVDIVFQPSRWEAMSMVLLEAAIAGKPVVCTAVGEAREILRHGETGLLVEPGDEVSMARALTALVQDPAFRERLGGAAAGELRDRCSAARMVAEYESLYRHVLDAAE